MLKSDQPRLLKSDFFIGYVGCDDVDGFDHSFDLVDSNRAQSIGNSQQCAAGAELWAKNKTASVLMVLSFD